MKIYEVETATKLQHARFFSTGGGRRDAVSLCQGIPKTIFPRTARASNTRRTKYFSIDNTYSFLSQKKGHPMEYLRIPLPPPLFFSYNYAREQGGFHTLRAFMRLRIYPRAMIVRSFRNTGSVGEGYPDQLSRIGREQSTL